MKTHSKTLLTGLAFAAGLTLSANAATLSVIDEGLDNSGINSGISNSNGSGKAINFVLAAGPDYQLADVVLGLSNVDGSETPIVQLWSDGGTSDTIGSLLETLTNPGTLVNGANTFTSSGTALEAGEAYWIVVTTDGSTFSWLGGNADTSVTSDIGATHTARKFPSRPQGGPGSDASLWTGTSSVLNQIQVNAVVPEPGPLALMGMGALCALRRRRG